MSIYVVQSGHKNILKSLPFISINHTFWITNAHCSRNGKSEIPNAWVKLIGVHSKVMSYRQWMQQNTWHHRKLIKISHFYTICVPNIKNVDHPDVIHTLTPSSISVFIWKWVKHSRLFGNVLIFGSAECFLCKLPHSGRHICWAVESFFFFTFSKQQPKKKFNSKWEKRALMSLVQYANHGCLWNRQCYRSDTKILQKRVCSRWLCDGGDGFVIRAFLTEQ